MITWLPSIMPAKMASLSNVDRSRTRSSVFRSFVLGAPPNVGSLGGAAKANSTIGFDASEAYLRCNHETREGIHKDFLSTNQLRLWRSGPKACRPLPLEECLHRRPQCEIGSTSCQIRGDTRAATSQTPSVSPRIEIASLSGQQANFGSARSCPRKPDSSDSTRW